MKTKLMVCLLALFTSIGISSLSYATNFTEVEPNDTFITAQSLDPQDGTVGLAGSRIGNSSADFYLFYATAGDSIIMAVNSPGGPTYTNDPILGLFNPSGTELTYDDDYNGYDPRIAYSISSSGFYGAAVSGYADFGWTGGGSSGWTYQLLITGLTPHNGVAVPEPATMFLLGLGLVGVAGVRRKVKK